MKKILIIAAPVILILTSALAFAWFFGFATYTCNDWDEISADVRADLLKSSKECYQLLLAEDPAAAWRQFHPRFQEDQSIESYSPLHKNLKYLLERAQGPEFENGKLVSLAGFKNKSRICIGGSLDHQNPDYLRFTILSGVKKQAVIIYNLQNGAVERRLGMKLGPDNGEYKLMAMQLAPHAMNGHDALYYATLGDRWIGEGRFCSASLAYNMAYYLGGLNQDIQDGTAKSVGEKIAGYNKNPRVTEEFKKLQSAFSGLKIYNIAAIETRDEICPLVNYVTGGQLDRETCFKESREILSKFKTDFPQLGDYFQTIMFRAYGEDPVSPTKQYPCFNVPLKVNG